MQLGVFSKLVNPSAFKGMYPISGDKSSGSKYTKYFAGMFYLFKSAQKYLPTIQKQGFKDAFIVAYLDGKVVKTEDVKNKERDQTSFATSYKDKVEESDNVIDQIRYEIKVQIPLTDSKSIERFNDYSFGNYKLDVEKDDDFKYYKITGFASFEITYREKSSIQDSIPYEAEIHAYFSNSKIPIETLKNKNN